MKHLLFLGTLLLIVLLVACAEPPTEVPPPPTVQNTMAPTRTRRPTPTITPALTGTRSPTATPDLRKVDPGLVYGKPYKAPCWFKMIPGKTTIKEMLNILPGLSAIESPSVFPSEEGIIPSLINTRPDLHSDMSVYLGIDFDKKVLQMVSNSDLSFDYFLGQLIAQFGEPEAVYDMYVVDAKRSCAEVALPLKGTTADALKYILYPQQGLLFTVITPFGDMLCPEMRVNSFCYYSPMTMQEALTNDRLADLCGHKVLEGVTEKDLIQWHGYGSGY